MQGSAQAVPFLFLLLLAKPWVGFQLALSVALVETEPNGIKPI